MVIAQKLRQIAGELRNDPKMNAVADVADRGAETVDRIERLSRERPWVAAGASVAAGIVAARLLKAMSRRGKH